MLPQAARPALSGQATKSPTMAAPTARTLSPVRTLKSPSRSQSAISAEDVVGSDAGLAQVSGALDPAQGDQKDAFVSYRLVPISATWSSRPAG